MASGFKLSDTSVANMIKVHYGDVSQQMYDASCPAISVLNKSYNSVGKQTERPIPFGIQGGVGSGTPPEANRAPYGKAIFTNKAVFGVVEVDTQTIKQCQDEGAFVDALKESTKKTIEAVNWNAERYTVGGAADGALGITSSISAVAGAGATYDLTIDNTNTTYPWVLGNWEVSQYVNIGSGDTSRFEITKITPSTRVVRVARISGSTVPTGALPVFLQGSENNDPEGLRGICDATTGQKYSSDVGYRWQAYRKDAGGANISPDLFNELLLECDKATGKMPTHALVSHAQMRRLLALGEDLKRYNVQPVELQGKGSVAGMNLGFTGIKVTCLNGSVTVLLSKFLADDRLILANFDVNEACHAPGWGWFDDEGFVFIRKNKGAAYEAMYGGFLQNYFPPTCQATSYNLATS